MNDVHISDAILNTRLALNLKQVEYAAIVEASQRQISDWENRRVSPSRKSRYLLVHKGGIDPRYIREDSVPAAPSAPNEAA